MDNKTNLISVIIPVYNTEEYLPRCLDSIINNVYKSLEVICVNDGSTDDSLKVLKEYEKIDSRIKVIDISHKGISFARNVGLDCAKGDYIAFIDSDDWIHKQYFEVLMHYIKISDAKIVSVLCKNVSDNIIDENVETSKMKYKKYINDKALNDLDIRIIIRGKLFCREYFSNIRFIENLNFGEDTIYMINCYTEVKAFSTISVFCKLYYYYSRDNSASKGNVVSKSIVLYKLFLEKIKCLNNKHFAWPYIAESTCRCLRFRYYAYRHGEEKQVIKEIEFILRENLAFEKKYHCLPFIKSVIYRLMILSPRLYSLYRFFR